MCTRNLYTESNQTRKMHTIIQLTGFVLKEAIYVKYVFRLLVHPPDCTDIALHLKTTRKFFLTNCLRRVFKFSEKGVSE